VEWIDQSGWLEIYVGLLPNNSTPCCSRRWGETMTINCGHQQAYCLSPRATVEWHWQSKTTNSERNLSQCHFVYHKSHVDWHMRTLASADINRLSHLLMLVEFCVNIHWFQRQCHIWQNWHFEACDSRPLHVKTTTINFIKTSNSGRAITMRRALSIFRLIRYSQHPVHKTNPLKLCRLWVICFHYADSFYFI
jgi:hypothetical protein